MFLSGRVAATVQSWHSVDALVPAADGGPGIRAERGRELLQLEPGAGLVRTDLKRDAFAQDVDG